MSRSLKPTIVFLAFVHTFAASSESFADTNREPVRVASESAFRITLADGTGLISSDGNQWFPTTINHATNWRSQSVGLDTFRNNIFISIDHSGGVQTSSNNMDWTARESGVSEALHRITYGNRLFVAVGNEGAIVTSPDAVTWTRQHSGCDERLRGIAYMKGIFVAVGYAGTILSSRDAIHWRPRRSGTIIRLMDVASDGAIFIAVGRQGIILTSSDGSHWKRIPTTTTNDFLRVSFGTNDIVQYSR